MKKIRFGIGGVLMIAAMAISDRGLVIVVYCLAALLHELGHIIAAGLLKVRIEEIRLGFSGVRIVTDSALTSYKNEIILAAAGPLMNFLSLSFSLAIFYARGIRAEEMLRCADSFLKGESESTLGMLGFFALSSLIQAVMNLLPVKTFDGGRILYCSVASLISQGAAERSNELCSALVAWLLWTVALYLMLRISSGLGIFVFAACIFGGVIMQRNGEI